MKSPNVKVLLVQPNYVQQRKYTKYSASPPMGLAYIAAVLEKNGMEVEILDANVLNLNTDDVVQQALDTKATIVGVSILMTGYRYSAELAKKLPKKILSVAGGAYPSAVPGEFLKIGFNVVVKGPGEYAMLDLALGKNINEIQGIYYRKNEKIVQNSPRSIRVLENLPFPARHLLVNNGVDKPYCLEGTMYFPWAPILTSLGCPFNCYYCSKQVFCRFLLRAPEDVVAEIRELVKKYDVKEIAINDDCFNADTRRAEKILDMIIKCNLNIKLRFPNGIRAEGVTQTFMEKMKKAGCVEVAYGIESGNQKVLDRIPKHTSLESIRKAVKYTKRAGIFTVGFFILGLLGDDEKSMQETVDFAKELELDAAFFSILTPFPATPLWNLIEAEGEFFIKDWDDLHQSSGKMFFSHPDCPAVDVVERMYKKAYRDFYLSPKYILRQLIALRQWNRLTLAVRGLSDIFSTQWRS